MQQCLSTDEESKSSVSRLMKNPKTERTTVTKAARKRPTKASLSPAASVIEGAESAAPIRQVETAESLVTAHPASLLQTYTEQLRTGELASRIAAASRLAELNDPQAMGALQQALRDPTAEVAREAALGLGKARATGVVEALTAVMENTDGYYHWSVRSAAADSLARLNDPRAIPGLTRGVRDPLAEPSRAAIRALGQVAREHAVQALVEVISNRENYFLPSVRVTAAEVLATLPVAVARQCLQGLVDNPSEDPEVRQAALLAFA
jgi:HEAT repeat protein